MPRYHLAQVNIARFRRPADDPVNADFMNGLDRVNAQAEASPGFVWRLVGDGDNATDIQAFDDPQVIVNLSLWTDLEALSAFAYRNLEHRAMFRRRAEWFDAIETHLALWWSPIGVLPTPQEARARLELLQRQGPTVEAFTFARPFAAQAAG